MAIFGFNADDLKEILKESEIRIIARINQLEKYIEENKKEIRNLKEDIEKIIIKLNTLEELINKTPKKMRGKSAKTEKRDKMILEYLKNPHNTKDVCQKFGYTRSYASFLLNNLKKRGYIKIHSKMGNIPYFITRGE